jgi:hypothetical protein
MLAVNRPKTLFALTMLGALTACASVPPLLPAPKATPDMRATYGVPPSKVKSDDGLSLARIEGYLGQRGTNMRHPRPGVWHVSIEGIILMTIADQERIRIIAPIFSLEQLDSEPAVQHALLRRLLQANFDQSADARYAVFDGIVFATVTSPRTVLVEKDLDRFVTQVVNLHKNTFRTGSRAYSSDDPEPDSIEIDPRKDDSLDLPEGYDRRVVPNTPAPTAKNDTISL